MVIEPPATVPPLPPPPRPRRHPLVRCLLFLVAFVVSQLLAAGLAVLGFWWSGREPVRTGEILILLYVLSAPLLFAVTLLFLRRLDRKDLASLGARWPEGGRSRALRQAVTVPLSVLALLGAWVLLVEVLPASDVHVAGLTPAATASSGPFRLLFLLLGFLIQGGVEEWVFRGYLYSTLKERWSWWVAALATSIGFGLLHAANPDFSAAALFNTSLAGFLLALLVERSRSLWSATLAHGIWNFAVASLASLPVSGLQVFHLLDARVTGPEPLTGGGFGPEGSLLLTALAVPLVALLWPKRRNGLKNGV